MPLLTLITEQIFARVPGGTGRYSREVSVALGESVPPGWRARSVTAWHRDTSIAEVPGLGGPRRLPVGGRVLARLWERDLPLTVAGSVLHALTPLAPGRTRARQALVVTVHDAVPFTHPDTLTLRGAGWHRLMIERASRMAAVLVVPTRAVAGELKAAGIGGRIEVIGEGTAAALTVAVSDTATERVRARFQLPDRYMITVGTMEPRKGLDVLLDALAMDDRAAEGPLLGVLAVVGQPGWGDQDLVVEAERRGLSSRVRVLGRLPDDEMAAVMAGAAVSVVPSRSEGFGLPLLEAMKRGIPVVHSNAPALVEVAGGAGRSVPVGDPAALRTAIADVLSDPDLAAGLSRAGRLRAADFSWEEVAGELWKLYTDVCPPDRPG